MFTLRRGADGGVSTTVAGFERPQPIAPLGSPDAGSGSQSDSES